MLGMAQPGVGYAVVKGEAISKINDYQIKKLGCLFSYARPSFYMATLEKAILDTVYLRGKLPVADEINWEFVNPKKLRKFLEKYPHSVETYLKTVYRGMIA